MKPVKMVFNATNRSLDFPTAPFLVSAFADEPFPDLLLAKSFADEFDSRFTELL